ncbi:hypothetical protein OF83DRAFT_616251 [Amylostereum chailletii]|nr:hypothetical protein OF83DRAFT_616251 [Amylostereum chailletii]
MQLLVGSSASINMSHVRRGHAFLTLPPCSYLSHCVTHVAGSETTDCLWSRYTERVLTTLYLPMCAPLYFNTTLIARFRSSFVWN